MGNNNTAQMQMQIQMGNNNTDLAVIRDSHGAFWQVCPYLPCWSYTLIHITAPHLACSMVIQRGREREEIEREREKERQTQRERERERERNSRNTGYLQW